MPHSRGNFCFVVILTANRYSDLMFNDHVAAKSGKAEISEISVSIKDYKAPLEVYLCIQT